MRSLFSSWVLALGALLPAQDPSPTSPAAPAPAPADALAAATQRLQQALQKTAGIVDTGFTARWGPSDDGKDPVQQFLVNTAGGSASKVVGSWHADLFHAAFDGDNGDELVSRGRRTIAKDGHTEWKLRRARFADGNASAFVPDPALLLQQLAAADLRVKRAAVGTLDDKPIEILTAELSAEDVAEATWSGALPELAGWAGAMIVQMAGGGQAARPAAAAPDATVDLAVLLDPATGLVHEIRARGWSKMAVAGARQFVVAGGGVVRFQRAAPQQEEGDDEKAAKDTGPVDGSVIDENGLPVRSRKNTSVTDFTVRLRDHGKKSPPPLTDAQQRLLGP